MSTVTFNKEICKGCALCVGACPKNILYIENRLNSKGFKPAGIREDDKCIGCTFCASMCPDLAIRIEL